MIWQYKSTVTVQSNQRNLLKRMNDLLIIIHVLLKQSIPELLQKDPKNCWYYEYE